LDANAKTLSPQQLTLVFGLLVPAANRRHPSPRGNAGRCEAGGIEMPITTAKTMPTTLKYTVVDGQRQAALEAKPPVSASNNDLELPQKANLRSWLPEADVRVKTL
jgi:hypothetical protein